MDFICNICGNAVCDCPVEQMGREIRSCPHCGSTVRFRNVVHVLSLALFGRSMALSAFPVNKDIVGLGMSDWDAYAAPLAAKLSYTNTFFHGEPFYDVAAGDDARSGTCDFVIATEVFEHVGQPIDRAFANAFDLLKPGGKIIFTVPWLTEAETDEHFPELHDYRIVRFGDEAVLVNRTKDGRYQLHRNLVFHGGEGETLEMRIFCRAALERHFARAGFVDVAVHGEDFVPFGILQNGPWSSPPFVALKPLGGRGSRIQGWEDQSRRGMGGHMEHWTGLAENDQRSLFLALIGNEFGFSPEQRIPEIRASRKQYAEYIIDQIDIQRSDTVVDIGSGCGFGTYRFAQAAHYVHACDISPAYLNFAKRECAELTNVSFYQIASRNLGPLADKSIDVAVSMSVFIHFNLYDIYWYFLELARVLKPGGRVWFDFADSEQINPLGTSDNSRYFLEHAKAYHRDPSALAGLMQWNSKTSIINIASGLGFEELTQNYPGHLRFQIKTSQPAPPPQA
jgi:SAM-dependent methyltransferase